MKFIDDFFSFVWDISDRFYDAYLEVNGWVWPFYLMANPLLSVSVLFWRLLTPIANFGVWVDDTATKVSNILTWDAIKSLLAPWLTYAENAWAWIQDAGLIITDIVNSLLKQVNTWLSNLQSAWDDFKGKIPSLDEVVLWWRNWTGNVVGLLTLWWVTKAQEVQGLINSAFVSREGLWSGWQDVKGNVVAFSSSPLDWLWERFADWFLGKE